VYYLDSNVLISFLFENEEHHRVVEDFLLKLATCGEGPLYTSTLSLTEAMNALCRKLRSGEQVIWPLNIYIEKLGGANACVLITSFLVGFIEASLKVKIIDDPSFYGFEKLNSTSIPLVFKQAIELTSVIDIRVKDLLHVAYALLLKRLRGVKYIITLDIDEFSKIKDKLERQLELSVIFPSKPAQSPASR
jgi:predicted nucleic acid-binding protein